MLQQPEFSNRWLSLFYPDKCNQIYPAIWLHWWSDLAESGNTSTTGKQHWYYLL